MTSTGHIATTVKVTKNISTTYNLYLQLKVYTFTKNNDFRHVKNLKNENGFY